jgi:hypothetical protein
MATFSKDPTGALVAEQAAGAALDYTLDWTDSLEPGEDIASSEWTAEAGLLVGSKSVSGPYATAWFSGGIAGRSYAVVNTVVTSTGRRDQKGIRFFVVDPAGPGAGHRPASAFGDLAAAVAAFRRDRLAGPAALWLAGVPLSDEYLLERLLAAEAYVEQRLRVFLTPVEVIPQFAHDLRAALEEAGERVVEEPGYDQEQLRTADAWRWLDLRHRPVRALRSVTLSLPEIDSSSYEMPLPWVRLDAKFGKLQLVPMTSGSMAIPGILLQSLATGRTLPLTIRVRYRAGLDATAREMPVILDLVRRLALLDILDDQFLPVSGSSSVDGLSQSRSWDGAKPRADIEARLDAIRQGLHGLRLAVV